MSAGSRGEPAVAGAARAAGPGGAPAAVRGRGLPAPELRPRGPPPSRPPGPGGRVVCPRRRGRIGFAPRAAAGARLARARADARERLRGAAAAARRAHAAGGNAPCDRHGRLGVAEGPELRHPRGRARRALAWMLVQPVAALPGRAAAAVVRIGQDADAARAAPLARRLTALARRGSRPVQGATPRPPRRPRDLARRGAQPRHRGDRDLRHGDRARRRRRACGADHAMARRAGRRPDHPPEARQAPGLRPRRLRAPASPRPPGPPIHTKRRKASKPGQDHPIDIPLLGRRRPVSRRRCATRAPPRRRARRAGLAAWLH